MHSCYRLAHGPSNASMLIILAMLVYIAQQRHKHKIYYTQVIFSHCIGPYLYYNGPADGQMNEMITKEGYQKFLHHLTLHDFPFDQA